jgi:hypothetical protein
MGLTLQQPPPPHSQPHSQPDPEITVDHFESVSIEDNGRRAATTADIAGRVFAILADPSDDADSSGRVPFLIRQAFELNQGRIVSLGNQRVCGGRRCCE